MTSIPWPAHLALISIAGLVGWLEARRLATKYPGSRLEDILRRSFHLYVLLPLFLLLLLGSLLLQQMRQVFWDLPLWLQYWSSALTWGGILVIFLLLFSLILPLAFRLRHQDRHKMAVVAVLFIAALEGLMQFLTRPLAPQLTRQENRDGIIMQSSPSSCVPASAANLLRLYGMERSEPELAALFGSTLLSGTSAAQLIYGMRQLGIHGQRRYAPDRDISKIKAPAMLFVDYAGTENHAVALLRADQESVELADPLVGRKRITPKELRKVWHGRAVEFSLSRQGC
ncbi:hypothetical protein GCAAIG_10455 [Candidatus Electronema halotolerans]